MTLATTDENKMDDQRSLLQDNCIRTQAVKREKSHSDSLEREKKRVKFSFNYSECSSPYTAKYQIIYSPLKGNLKDNKRLSVPCKGFEKGILKNKPKISDDNQPKSSNNLDLSNKVVVNSCNEVVTESSKEVVKDVHRQGTFTKDQNLKKEKEGKSGKSLLKTCKEETNSEKKNKLKNDGIAEQKNKIKKSVLSSKSRVNPSMSELTPKIYPKTERKGTLKLKLPLPQSIHSKKVANDGSDPKTVKNKVSGNKIKNEKENGPPCKR